MKLALWNIDHPENDLKNPKRTERCAEIKNYLEQQKCDLLILCEANSCLELPGYQQFLSTESPYLKKSRCYEPPNKYHQVAIYSKLLCEQLTIEEPINGLLCKIEYNNQPLFIYGNVITIKDQWKEDSNKKFSDRLNEQIIQFQQLIGKTFFIAGDFNLKKGWTQKNKAYRLVDEFVSRNNLQWPTQEETETVQHVIHSGNLTAEIEIDYSVQHSGKEKRLSDHPFVAIYLK